MNNYWFQLLAFSILTLHFVDAQDYLADENCFACVVINPVAKLAVKNNNDTTMLMQTLQTACQNLRYQGFFNEEVRMCTTLVNSTANVMTIRDAINNNPNDNACESCKRTPFCTATARPCSPNIDDTCRACVNYIPFARLQLMNTPNDTVAMATALNMYCDSLSSQVRMKHTTITVSSLLQEVSYTQQLSCRMQVNNNATIVGLIDELTSHVNDSACETCTHINQCVTNARPCQLHPDDYCRVCTTLTPIAVQQIKQSPNTSANDLQLQLTPTCDTLQYLGYTITERTGCTNWANSTAAMTGLLGEINAHPDENPCDICTHLTYCSATSRPCGYIEMLNGTMIPPMDTTSTMSTTTTSIATFNSISSSSIIVSMLMIIVTIGFI